MSIADYVHTKRVRVVVTFGCNHSYTFTLTLAESARTKRSVNGICPCCQVRAYQGAYQQN